MSEVRTRVTPLRESGREGLFQRLPQAPGRLRSVTPPIVAAFPSTTPAGTGRRVPAPDTAGRGAEETSSAHEHGRVSVAVRCRST